ncbi:hypothetical protein LguiA_021700 [Lonicera macranthoides]
MAFDFSFHTERKSTRGTQATSQAPSKPPAVGLLSRSQFPKDFTFGSASSAFQIEGAVDQDGRLPSIWDTFAKEHEGCKAGGENPKGIAFYNNLINELLANVQLLDSDDFRDYADVCFRAFGDRVKKWITFNEPWSFSFGGYAVGTLAPGHGYIPTETKGPSIAELLPPSPFSFPRSGSRSLNTPPLGDPGREPYVVSHNQLLAHGAAVKLYREKYQVYGSIDKRTLSRKHARAGSRTTSEIHKRRIPFA